MSFYCDTSALVKIYHVEPGTDKMMEIYESDEVLLLSELARIEFISAIQRKYREQAITGETVDALIARFDEDRDARFLLALKLYELGRISSGKAARLAGVQRIVFLMKLGQYQVSPFQSSLSEIIEEF